MTDKKKALTPREAYALLTKFVEEKGADYVYAVPSENETCMYVHNGAPSCLVGHVLVAVGVPLEKIEVVEETAAHIALPRLLDVSVALADALDAAQKKQDAGKPWGEALKRFEEVLDENGVEYK